MKQVGKSNWYELSDGTKVQGKANAEAAEALLDDDGSTQSRYGNGFAAVVGQEAQPENHSRYGAPYAAVAAEETEGE